MPRTGGKEEPRKDGAGGALGERRLWQAPVQLVRPFLRWAPRSSVCLDGAEEKETLCAHIPLQRALLLLLLLLLLPPPPPPPPPLPLPVRGIPQRPAPSIADHCPGTGT
ncbi:uncharacterized protein LOC110212569 [Phascolarctos cinereus]|uniref:Zinc finger protein 318-like n=1 Tax=Phascolarctos cinereus TaxID=38626 RepID=A0A6P5KXQ5_PHACI|nr:zinc finger protein 318-like [Phascolarctos cinereus]XP_020848236.1 zinc finger protein 318-like [Phascolarctos cinereus]